MPEDFSDRYSRIADLADKTTDPKGEKLLAHTRLSDQEAGRPQERKTV